MYAHAFSHPLYRLMCLLLCFWDNIACCVERWDKLLPCRAKLPIPPALCIEQCKYPGLALAEAFTAVRIPARDASAHSKPENVLRRVFSPYSYPLSPSKWAWGEATSVQTERGN